MENGDPVALKIEILREILAITQKMRECAQKGAFDEVLTLLEERGQLIQQVDSLDREVGATKLSEEKRLEMLSLLHQIAVLNEEVSARLFAALAREQETLSRLRESRSFLQSVRENLPAPSGELDAQG